jgi:hypothetical protein
MYFSTQKFRENPRKRHKQLKSVCASVVTLTSNFLGFFVSMNCSGAIYWLFCKINQEGSLFQTIDFQESQTTIPKPKDKFSISSSRLFYLYFKVSRSFVPRWHTNVKLLWVQQDVYVNFCVIYNLLKCYIRW